MINKITFVRTKRTIRKRDIKRLLARNNNDRINIYFNKKCRGFIGWNIFE